MKMKDGKQFFKLFIIVTIAFFLTGLVATVQADNNNAKQFKGIWEYGKGFGPVKGVWDQDSYIFNCDTWEGMFIITGQSCNGFCNGYIFGHGSRLFYSGFYNQQHDELSLSLCPLGLKTVFINGILEE